MSLEGREEKSSVEAAAGGSGKTEYLINLFNIE
jgi:hypothetical protein